MLREHFHPPQEGGEPDFRWRGGNVSRIESLADVVFGFILTLLVVSLEVPVTYRELVDAFWQLPVFLACFAMLVMVWYYHYLYFRRYGLEDFTTMVLNAALLFVLLFYAFPLKFLFGVLMRMARGLPNRAIDELGREVPIFDAQGQILDLMRIYGAGFAGVFFLFAMMHVRAWKKRDELALDPVERAVTLGAMRAHWLSVSIGLVSIALTFCTGPTGFWPGMTYALMGPLHAVQGWRTGRTVVAARKGFARAT